MSLHDFDLVEDDLWEIPDLEEEAELDAIDAALGAGKKNPCHRNRAYRRRMFLKKEKNLRDKKYRRVQCVNNGDYVRKFLSALFDKDVYEAQGVRLSVIRRMEKEFDVLVENSINNTESVIEVRRGRYRPWVFYTTRNAYHPIYYKRFYPTRTAAKKMANSAVRNYHEYDEDGYEVSFPKGRHFRKVFQSYDICEY